MKPEWRKPPPSGCATVEQHEAWFLDLASMLDAQIANLLKPSKDGTVAPMVVSRAKELALVAIKARKCAADLALERESNEHIDWLDEQRKKMTERRRGGPERIPLRSIPKLDGVPRTDPDGAA